MAYCLQRQPCTALHLLQTHNVSFYLACAAGVEGEGKGKKKRAKCVSMREGDSSPPNSPAVVLTLCFDLFPPFLRPATQATFYISYLPWINKKKFPIKAVPWSKFISITVTFHLSGEARSTHEAHTHQEEWTDCSSNGGECSTLFICRKHTCRNTVSTHWSDKKKKNKTIQGAEEGNVQV